MEEESDVVETADNPAEVPETAVPNDTSSQAKEPAQTAQPVYAIGKVEPNIPSPGIQKELDQAIARADSSGQTDREAMRTVLSLRENRYLARQVCFSFTIEGLPTYLLVPREAADIEFLIDALRSRPAAGDLDVVIGNRGPVAPAQVCNGLSLPVVVFDQLYSFDVDTLIASIPRPDAIPANQEEQFRSSAEELFGRVMQTADNAGNTDEHRAMNYLAVRYPNIYSTTAEAHSRNLALSRVEARRSRLSGARNIIDVIFSYTHRQTDVTEQYFTRVDVTENFPFLMNSLAPYYERP